jgi:outer membrane protein TolC
LRYKDGVATSYDVLNARVNLSNARLSRVTDKNQERIDRLALDRAMGVVAHASYRVVAPSHLSSPDLNPDRAVALALSRRPDLKTLTEQARAQKQVVKFDQAQFFPTVQTVGAYSLDSEFFPLVYNWSVGTTLTIPIFNGFQFVHQTQMARAQMRQMIFQREDLRQQAIVEVRSDILNIKTYREKVAADTEIVAQARQNLFLAENQFRVGTGTSVAVTQSERDLASARSNLVRDKADLAIAIATLRHDQGVNLDPGTHRIPRDLP